MGNYYFKNNIEIEDFRYVFLCGVSLNFREKSKDKREILSCFIQSEDENARPIILEKNFLTRSSKRNRNIAYSDAGFSNLYQVEMLVNYLSDINFIILESISTGAEAGMFLGEPKAQEKTCLLIPDEMAIEENKLGAFLKFSFEHSNVSIMTFYPQIKPYKLSDNISGWYTFFNNNLVGKYLGDDITKFISDKTSRHLIGFSTSRESLSEGKIFYKIDEERLVIEICPRTLMICVGALLSCEEYSSDFFSNTGHTIQEIESTVVSWLQTTFINSIAEIDGQKAKNCNIKIDANMDDLGPNRAIGMIIYLFKAAELITIKKMKDYADTKKVRFGKKMLTIGGIKNRFFYNKYDDCIERMVEKKIIV